MNYRPLFVTGPARSGSTLLAHLLSAHPDIMVASDPYFPLMRSLRNALARGADDFDPGSPFQDYYFCDGRIRLLDAVQQSSIDIQFEHSDWEALLTGLIARAQFESPDLVPYMGDLRADTYRGIFDNALDLIGRIRDSSGKLWVGFKEVWTIELTMALARGYPEARFLVIMRDPRAITWSMLALGEEEPSQIAHTLSYARHWRKYCAFISRYRRDPDLAKRIEVVRYEDLVGTPRLAAERLCKFLDLPFSELMLDSNRYIDYKTNARWMGNSSFGEMKSSAPRKSWKQSMPEALLKLFDLTCGPEMGQLGYAPVNDSSSSWMDSTVFTYLCEQDRLPCSWRSDLGQPEADYGAELLRRSLLAGRVELEDASLIRRYFLFMEQYLSLRGGAA